MKRYLGKILIKGPLMFLLAGLSMHGYAQVEWWPIQLNRSNLIDYTIDSTEVLLPDYHGVADTVIMKYYGGYQSHQFTYKTGLLIKEVVENCGSGFKTVLYYRNNEVVAYDKKYVRYLVSSIRCYPGASRSNDRVPVLSTKDSSIVIEQVLVVDRLRGKVIKGLDSISVDLILFSDSSYIVDIEYALYGVEHAPYVGCLTYQGQWASYKNLIAFDDDIAFGMKVPYRKTKNLNWGDYDTIICYKERKGVKSIRFDLTYDGLGNTWIDECIETYVPEPGWGGF